MNCSIQEYSLTPTCGAPEVVIQVTKTLDRLQIRLPIVLTLNICDVQLLTILQSIQSIFSCFKPTAFMFLNEKTISKFDQKIFLHSLGQGGVPLRSRGVRMSIFVLYKFVQYWDVGS